MEIMSNANRMKIYVSIANLYNYNRAKRLDLIEYDLKKAEQMLINTNTK